MDNKTLNEKLLHQLNLPQRKMSTRVVIGLISQGADVNLKGLLDRAVIHHFCTRGDEDDIKYLIEQGADVNAEDCFKQSPLQLAAQHGRDSIVRNLIEAGADINARGERGKTALMFTIIHARIESLKLLLKGSDLSIQDDDDNTALDLDKLSDISEVSVILESHIKQCESESSSLRSTSISNAFGITR